ncbi:MAG: hypothetical protein R3E01_09700 [Pirellulaceae bacterium]
MQDVSLQALQSCEENAANKAFARSRGGQPFADGKSLAAASVNADVLSKSHGCPQPYRGNAARHDALSSETRVALCGTRTVRSGTPTLPVIAPAMERMLNPCRSTTSAYEYEYRDAEYDCDPCAGP